MMAPSQARSIRRLSAAPNSDDAQSHTARLIIGSISSLKIQMIETNCLLNEKLDGIQADLDTLQAFVKKATPLIDADLAKKAKAYNAESVSKNRDIRSRDEFLHPLRSDTNEEILGFPQTIRDLECLEEYEIWKILFMYNTVSVMRYA